MQKNSRDCKEATFLIEKQMQTHLKFGEQIKLKLHLYGCSWCKTYQRQSKNIETLIGQLFHQPQNEKLTKEFKNDLQLLITEKLNHTK